MITLVNMTSYPLHVLPFNTYISDNSYNIIPTDDVDILTIECLHKKGDKITTTLDLKDMSSNIIVIGSHSSEGDRCLLKKKGHVIKSELQDLGDHHMVYIDTPAVKSSSTEKMQTSDIKPTVYGYVKLLQNDQISYASYIFYAIVILVFITAIVVAVSSWVGYVTFLQGNDDVYK